MVFVCRRAALRAWVSLQNTENRGRVRFSRASSPWKATALLSNQIQLSPKERAKEAEEANLR